MTILFQDNFDTDTVGTIAPGWVNKVGTWAVGTRNPVSGSNTFGSTSDADGDVTLYTALATRADMQFDFAQKAVKAGPYFPLVGGVLRSDVGNNNNYTVLFSHVDGTAVTILIFKRVSGAFTLIANLNASLAVVAGDTVRGRFKIVGNLISVFAGKDTIPSSPLVTFTDGTITGAGYPGLYYAKDGQTISYGVDDFVYGDTLVVLPGAPTIGTATSGTGSATVTFTPGTTGSSPTTSYLATASTGETSSASGSPISFPTLSAGVARTFHVQGVSADGTGPASAESNSVTPTGTSNNALIGATGSIKVSPGNWDVQASTIKTINAGAEFSFLFGGTSCALNFDITGIASPLPQISYRVDRFSPWVNTPITSSVVITIPSDTSDYSTKPGHLLEVRVKSMTETQPRWSTQSTAVKLTGIILDIGKGIAPPPALLPIMVFGDSITEGVRTVNMTAPNDTDRNDSGQGWALELGRLLGVDVGVVGFGGSGFTVTGSGGVPALSTTYNQLYSGVSRTFPPNLQAIVIMLGTNDSGDVTAGVTAALNGFLAATTCKVVVLRPFNGTAHASQLQAAIAASTAPARCTYVDTAGFFTTANSSDNLHPYGVENITHIAPLVANAVRSVIGTGGTLITNSISLVSGRLRRSATGAAIPSGKRLRVS